MRDSSTKRGLVPIVDARSHILILGTLPGDESLRKQQYYGHPQNQFWRMVYAAYGNPDADSYEAKIALAFRNGLAIWDVLHSATRDGSLDAAIQNPEPNAFGPFFERYRRISAIGFNGRRAEQLFWHYVAKKDGHDPASAIRRIILPSTSPAATRPFEEKLVEWQVFLRDNAPDF